MPRTGPLRSRIWCRSCRAHRAAPKVVACQGGRRSFGFRRLCLDSSHEPTRPYGGLLRCRSFFDQRSHFARMQKRKITWLLGSSILFDCAMERLRSDLAKGTIGVIAWVAMASRVRRCEARNIASLPNHAIERVGF